MKESLLDNAANQQNPSRTGGERSPKKKKKKKPNSPQTKTLLSVRVKTTGEKKELSFVSLAAYDRGYPPFHPQQ